MISYQLSPFHKKKEPIVISKADRAERIFKKKDGERTENAMENLKPCPFCGGEAELRMIGDMRYLLVYFCKNCRKTPLRGGDARSTERDARKIWNRRVEAWNRRANDERTD